MEEDNPLSVSRLKNEESKGRLADGLRRVHEALKALRQGERRDELEDLALFLASAEVVEIKNNKFRILVACCLADVIRICAPEAPYSESKIKYIFESFIRHLRGVEDVDNPLWSWNFYLLEKLAMVKAFVMIAEDEDLVAKTFESLYASVVDGHSYKVFSLMQSILITIVEETVQPVEQWLLDSMLQPFTGGSRRSQELAFSVLRRCSSLLQSPISNFLNSMLAQDGSLQSELGDHKKELIVALNRVSSDFLLYVIPNLERELTSGNPRNRLQTVETMYEVFLEPESSAVKDYPPLYKVFLRRFTDVESSIRKQMCSSSSQIVQNHAWTAPDFTEALVGRLMDFDEGVRQEAVRALFDIRQFCGEDGLRQAGGRMLDKDIQTRQAAIECVTSLLAEQVGGSKGPLTDVIQANSYPSLWNQSIRVAERQKEEPFEWIPSTLMKCARALKRSGDAKSLYLIERAVFDGGFFPKHDTSDGIRRWLSTFGLVDESEREILKTLLFSRVKNRKQFKAAVERRKRLLEGNLSSEKDSVTPSTGSDSGMTDGDLKDFVSTFAKSFPVREVEGDAAKLMKALFRNENVLFFENLARSLRAHGSWTECIEASEEAATECAQEASPDLLSFFKDHVLPMYQARLFAEGHLEAIVQAAGGDKNHSAKEFAAWFLRHAAPLDPEAFEAVSDPVADLLLSSKDPTVAMQILSSMGECFRVKGDKLGAVNNALVEVCLSADVAAAKWAARALIQMSGDDAGLSVWQLLEQRLGSTLSADEPNNVVGPMVTLAQIASKSAAVWELFKEKGCPMAFRILSGTMPIEKKLRADTCKWAIKVLTHAVSTRRLSSDSSQLGEVDEVLAVLFRVSATNGDIFNVHDGDEDKSSTDPDCGKIRLANSSSVLRISRSMSAAEQTRISPESFVRTVLVAQDVNPDIRLAFAGKIYRGILQKRLQIRWVVGLIFMAVDPDKDNMEVIKKYMATLMKVWRMRVEDEKKKGGKDEIYSILPLLPESVLPSVVWMLAHHPDVELDREHGFSDTRKYLEFFFSGLLKQSDYASFLLQMLQTIVLAEDATDNPIPDEIQEAEHTPSQRLSQDREGQGTTLLRSIARLGLEILHDMQSGKKWDLTQYPGRFSLPEDLYRTNGTEKKLLKAAKEIDKPKERRARRGESMTTSERSARASNRRTAHPEPASSSRRTVSKHARVENTPRTRVNDPTNETSLNVENARVKRPRSSDKRAGDKVQASTHSDQNSPSVTRQQKAVSAGDSEGTVEKEENQPDGTSPGSTSKTMRLRSGTRASHEELKTRSTASAQKPEHKVAKIIEKSAMGGREPTRRQRKRPKRYSDDEEIEATNSKTSGTTVTAQRAAAKT